MRKLIKLEKDDRITFNQNITEFLASEEIYVPIKKNYQLLVKHNDYVLKDQIIMENNLNKVVSPISGFIGDIQTKNVDDVFMKCLNIHNDFKEKSKLNRKKDTTIEKTLDSFNYYKTANKYEIVKILHELITPYKNKIHKNNK